MTASKSLSVLLSIVDEIVVDLAIAVVVVVVVLLLFFVADLLGSFFGFFDRDFLAGIAGACSEAVVVGAAVAVVVVVVTSGINVAVVLLEAFFCVLRKYCTWIVVWIRKMIGSH